MTPDRAAPSPREPEAAETPFAGASDAARLASADPQERNRLWWERLPMTYEPWEASQRVPEGKEAFDRLNAAYLGHNPWIAKNVDFTAFAGRRVLEIGCGGGTATVLFARAGARVTAVDITQAAVDMTRANLAAQGLAATVIRADAEQLPLPDGSFDFVYSWGVIHHSSRPDAIFDHVARVLAPGGRFLVMVYNRRSLRYWGLGLAWLVFRGKAFQGHGFRSVQAFFTDGYHHRHYSARELAEALRRAGLAVTRTSVTYMARRMVPGLPRALDERLKTLVGWLLVADGVKG